MRLFVDYPSRHTLTKGLRLVVLWFSYLILYKHSRTKPQSVSKPQGVSIVYFLKDSASQSDPFFSRKFYIAKVILIISPSMEPPDQKEIQLEYLSFLHWLPWLKFRS